MALAILASVHCQGLSPAGAPVVVRMGDRVAAPAVGPVVGLADKVPDLVVHSLVPSVVHSAAQRALPRAFNRVTAVRAEVVPAGRTTPGGQVLDRALAQVAGP